MDREILFRGKRLDNGEWGYGVPLYDLAECSLKKQGKCKCAHGGELITFFAWEDDYHEYEEVEVDPSTVGQYTGLTDKNGKKIFEGDIIKQTNFYDQLKIQGPVVYGKAAQYIVRHTYTEQENPYKKGKTKAFAVSPRCEVIGNIHDNHELIGGEGDG